MTTIDQTDPSFVFTNTSGGSWFLVATGREYGGNAMETWTVGSTATVSFTGSSIQLYGTVAVGINASVRIDDGDLVELSQKKGETTYQQLLYESSDFPYGEHRLVATEISDAFPLIVDFVHISGPPDVTVVSVIAPTLTEVTSPATRTASDSSSPTLKKGEIVGITIGGIILSIVFIVLLVFVVYLWKRHKRHLTRMARRPHPLSLVNPTGTNSLSTTTTNLLGRIGGGGRVLRGRDPRISEKIGSQFKRLKDTPPSPSAEPVVQIGSHGPIGEEDPEAIEMTTAMAETASSQTVSVLKVIQLPVRGLRSQSNKRREASSSSPSPPTFPQIISATGDRMSSRPLYTNESPPAYPGSQRSSLTLA